MVIAVYKFVQSYRSNGKEFHYYRRAGRRIRLTGIPGSAEFAASYAAAEIKTAQKKGVLSSKTAPGTFQALWNDFEKSKAYQQIGQLTRDDYRRLIAPALKLNADVPPALLTPQWVVAVRDSMVSSSRGNAFVVALKRLLNWGMKNGYPCPNGNPAARIEPLRIGAGHRIWTDNELATMTGPDAAAVALPVLIGRYTGQRLADIICLTWAAYDGQSITLTQRKSRHNPEPTRLVLPVHPRLKTALDAARGDPDVPKIGRVCIRPDGQPWKLDHFKHVFAATRRRLGLPDDLHFHGLRGTAATALAEAGATLHQIKAITGHKSDAMVARYTRQASQSQIAESAAPLLDGKRSANKIV